MHNLKGTLLPRLRPISLGGGGGACEGALALVCQTVIFGKQAHDF